MDYSSLGYTKSDSVINIKAVTILVLLLILNILLADPGWRKYGWQIYDNAGDARSIALGNTSIADHQNRSVLWNPAINIGNIHRNFTYGHQSRFAGIIQSDFISFPFSTKNNRLFQVVLLHESVSKISDTKNLLLDWGVDGVPNTGDIGENNGYLDDGERLDNENISLFSQHQLGVQISTKFQLYGLEFGTALKTLFHTIGDNIGSGISIDLGMTKKLWTNANLGVSVRNILPGMVVWDSGIIELTKPQLLAGFSQGFNFTKFPIEFLILTDILLNISDRSLNDDFNYGSTGVNWRFGVELAYNKRVNVRAGRNQYGFYTTGLGMSWDNIELNYAYQLNSNSVDLGTNHVLSFTLNPKWLASKIKKHKE